MLIEDDAGITPSPGGGNQTTDAGIRAADAGKPTPDAGVAPFDAGVSDAGTQYVDAGRITDAGSNDAGAITDAVLNDAGAVADAGPQAPNIANIDAPQWSLQNRPTALDSPGTTTLTVTASDANDAPLTHQFAELFRTRQ